MADSPGVRFSAQAALEPADGVPPSRWPIGSPSPWRAAPWLSRPGVRRSAGGPRGRDGTSDAFDPQVRRALLAVLLTVVLTAVGSIQVIRWAQPPPIVGAGRYDTTQMMGSCPATRECFLRQGVGPIMDASATSAFPTLAVTSASSLVDAATEETVAQRMTMTDGNVRAILWVIEQHGAAKMRMMYQTVELGARVVVSAWPVDGSTMRGATVLLFGSPAGEFPVDAARQWVRTPGLYE